MTGQADRRRSQGWSAARQRVRSGRVRAAMLLALAALLPSVAASAEDRPPAHAGSSNAAQPRPVRPVSVQPAPRWTLSAEVIALARSGTGNQPLVSLVPGDVYWLTQTGINTSNYPGVEALNSNQLGPRLAAGPRLSLSFRDPSGLGFDLSYFNVLGLTARKAIGPTNPAQWLVMKAPGTFWQTQDYIYQSMVWQDDSRLHSLEANARLELAPRVTLLLGARWLQLRDQLKGTLDPADLGQPLWKFGGPSRLWDAVPAANSTVVVNPPFWTTIATNNLYGVQIGAKAALWEAGPWSLGGTIKAGLFNNRAEHVSLVSMEKQIFPAQTATNAAAFVGEGSLVAKYQLSDAIALKLGYEALWLNGIALAPGQIQEVSTTRSTVSAQGVNCRSSTLFQGLTFGVDYTF